MPVDYRSLEAPAEIGTSLPDNGAAMKAHALSQAFAEFGGQRMEEFRELRAHAGEMAGAEAGQTGDPNFKEGLQRLSAYGKAYNNAALGAYILKSQASVDAAASQIRFKANGDPAVFDQLFTAHRDGALAGAPVEARAELARIYNQRHAEIYGTMTYDQLIRQRDAAKAQYSDGLNNMLSQAAAYYSTGDATDHATGMDLEAQARKLIDGGASPQNNFWTAEEATQMKYESLRKVWLQSTDVALDRALRMGHGAFAVLQKFQTEHEADLRNPVAGKPLLDEDLYKKAIADFTMRIRSQGALEAENKREGKMDVEATQKASYARFMGLAALGQTNAAQIGEAVLHNELDPHVAPSILSVQASVKSEPASNERSLAMLYADPHRRDMTVDEFRHYPGVNSKDALAMYERTQTENKGWQGADRAKQAIERMHGALTPDDGIPMRYHTPAEQRAYLTAHQYWLDEMAKVPPSQREARALPIADEAVKAAQRAIHAENAQTIRDEIDRLQRNHNNPDYTGQKFNSEADFQQAIQSKQGQLKTEQDLSK